MSLINYIFFGNLSLDSKFNNLDHTFNRINVFNN
jgi:hypothetical protein